MTRVILYGFGSVGRWTTKILLARDDFEIIGLIDNDPSLLGRDPGEILGIGKTGLQICSADEVLPRTDADVVLHSTVTDINTVFSQMRPFIELGISVITSSEDLIYPWRTHLAVALEMDSLAKRCGARIIATGVNPGFTTDLLPLVLCGASQRVDRVIVKRVVDFSEYPAFKPPYMGFGMNPDEFTKHVAGGIWKIGRNPLPGRVENIYLIADTLGWNLDAISVSYEPIITKTQRDTPWGFSIEPGMVTGVKQVGLGITENTERIRLESIAMCRPLPQEDGLEPGNIIIIEGDPSHHLTLTGGTVHRGGYVTSSRQVNLIPTILNAPYGLLTMRTIPSILNKNVTLTQYY